MAFTQADLTNIRACIGSGVLETRFADGSSVRYQSLADMMAAETRIASAIASTTPGAARRRRHTPAWRNGC